MEKTGFTIVIGDTPYEEWGMDKDEQSMNYCPPISGGIFLTDGMMYDQHIEHLYPELAKLEVFEDAEGSISYWGKLTKEELKSKLTEMGFRVEISNDLTNY